MNKLLVFFLLFAMFKPVCGNAQSANIADSLILVNFYNASNGPTWSLQYLFPLKQKWLSGPLVNWSGVTLDANGRVKELDFSGDSINGSIPAAFGSLDSLERLDFSYNNLTGIIPPELGKLSKLWYLALYENKLTGSIPPELGKLGKLTYMDFSGNKLTGSIPAELGNLSKLTYLDIYRNQLSGNIPAELANLKVLSDLELDRNHLSGNIPLAVSNMPSLYDFWIDQNYFTFDGMEAVAQRNNFFHYPPQDTILPLRFIANTLTTSAGGTLANNTYTWYRDSVLVKTVTGDSSYVPTQPGRYSATVTNAIATRLALKTDTLSITGSELPLTMVSFTGQLKQNTAILSWQTANEINTAFFNIQRGMDNGGFVTVGNVKAYGGRGSTQNYVYDDVLPAQIFTGAKLYYRLLQVDKDGKDNYSKVIALTPATVRNQLTIYPNPVQNTLKVSIGGVVGIVNVSVVNGEGKRILTKQVNLSNGSEDFLLDVSSISSGIYILIVEFNGQTLEQKIVKQ